MVQGDQPALGQLVYSIAGRDAGRPFVVIRKEEAYAYIADGRLRPLEKPKKKKIKHLRCMPQYAEVHFINNAALRKTIADLVQTKRSDSNG